MSKVVNLLPQRRHAMKGVLDYKKR